MRSPDYPNADVPRWAAVDAYFSERLAPVDPQLQEALGRSSAAGLPQHEVSAVQGKFLALLVGISQAKRVLEIGTLGGYSTIWMARALPAGGKIVTLERNADYAEVARRNFVAAGVDSLIELRIGSAADVLPTLQAPFDLFFIDADKPNNPLYLDWALKLARPGSIIIGDNVVRGGAVVDPESPDANVIGVRQFIDRMSTDPRLEATALQTVGEKGWDGFSIARVTG
ncbi:O-methyltransferase [Paucibacter sp. APW11]|uniref:O-methyltransferase n=1 Tax=Roseateles aquae TaxID=3077235 RepID=A0ABU3P678_9BURK|nr:O-methyltransferase [Paucibacter sp. APW11]MDT8998082.1 O-methyltransferase [Paucibacter sp. APW11]